MNKNIWVVVGVLVLIAVGWFLFGGNYVNGPAVVDDTENVEEMGEEEAPVSEVPVEDGADEVVAEDDEVSLDSPNVSFDGSAYSPNILTVEAGTTVVFENNSDRNMWPASAIHPTHTLYPGSSIAKCGTEDADSIFDACGAVNPGDSYSFTFDEVGEWKYHDHLRPSANGRIVVN